MQFVSFLCGLVVQPGGIHNLCLPGNRTLAWHVSSRLLRVSKGPLDTLGARG